jgi:hypothetical protein
MDNLHSLANTTCPRCHNLSAHVMHNLCDTSLRTTCIAGLVPCCTVYRRIGRFPYVPYSRFVLACSIHVFNHRRWPRPKEETLWSLNHRPLVLPIPLVCLSPPVTPVMNPRLCRWSHAGPSHSAPSHPVLPEQLMRSHLTLPSRITEPHILSL